MPFGRSRRQPNLFTRRVGNMDDPSVGRRRHRLFGRHNHAHSHGHTTHHTHTHHTHARRQPAVATAPVHHHRRRPSMKDKVSGALLRLKGTITHRPGVKAAGTRRMHGTDGRGARHVGYRY